MIIINRVLVINHFPTGFALARYTSTLSKIGQGITEVVNVKFNPLYNDFPQGIVYKGTRYRTINLLAKKIVYRKLVKLLNNNLSNGGLIHYTEQSMPFFTKGGDQEVVTFHDLFSLNERNGFSSAIYIKG